jgi:hypothetical protein
MFRPTCLVIIGYYYSAHKEENSLRMRPLIYMFTGEVLSSEFVFLIYQVSHI